MTTRLVQINVIAQDRKGKPVTGLTLDDFSIKDEGKDQKISLFSLETSGPAKFDNSVDAGRPTVVRTFSNRVEQRTHTVTAILFDNLNTRFQDQAYAKQELIKYLRQVQPGDAVGLYVLGSNLQVLHDFTTSTASLLGALSRYKGRINNEVADSEPLAADTGNDELDQFLDRGNQAIADYTNVNRAQQTMSALESIAGHLGRLPGRKNLVWISGGFPFSIGLDAVTGPGDTREKRTFSVEAARAATALSNANLAVYPVDARALMTDARFAADRGGGTGKANRAMLERPPPVDRNYDTMEVMAERTGGRAFHNVNDLAGAIRQAIDESRVTYVLGFYPAHQTWDGEFHQLKVQVKRPGVRIRYRPGYFAVPDSPAENIRTQETLTKAIAGALDATGVGITVSLEPKPTGYKASINVDPRNISLEEKEGKWVGALDLLIATGNSVTRNFSGKPTRINIRLSPEAHDGVAKRGLTILQDVPMPGSADQVRVAVRDLPSGATGSIVIKHMAH
ncbi:MAG: VWA domain-containing protein [Acidobacteriota bacterium]|nr:VWA domain-containing protein [Acidobacteriota bacterium]